MQQDKNKRTESITLIHYLDHDNTPLFEAAEWRTSHKGGAWCLAGSVDDVPLQINKVIRTSKINTDNNIQFRTPSMSEHNPDPIYIRKLISETGMTQITIGKLIGVSDRSMREYTRRPIPATTCPYPVQFALECLTENRKSLKNGDADV